MNELIAKIALKDVLINQQLIIPATQIIANDNQSFDPDPTWDLWAQVYFLPVGTFGSTLSSRFHSGIMQINVMQKRDSGTLQAEEFAQQLIGLYPYQSELVNGLFIDRLEIERGMNTDETGADFYMLPVSVYYQASINT